MAIQLSSEKTVAVPFTQRNKSKFFTILSILAVTALYSVRHLCCEDGVAFWSSDCMDMDELLISEPACNKVEPLIPSFNKSIDTILYDPEFKKRAIERLSGAVQVPTEVQDVNPDPKVDPEYYHHFVELHDFLITAFPVLHKHFKVDIVNEFGILYTWEGKNLDLKPILFMAHRDVVPVNRETLDEWKYPPFSGHYEEETDLLYGRGSNDCKNLLTAQFEAFEKLLIDGYETERTVLFAVGFDEEASGIWGAQHTSAFVHERYGDDGLFIILDEGAGITQIDENVFVATPVNAEKGYVDVEITISGHGGHSSIPPDHTTIGIASDLITVLENHPYDFEFEVTNPIYGTLTCAAEHSKQLSKKWKKTILNAPFNKHAKDHLTEYLSKQPLLRDLIRSTQAVDIIHGGVKANALPEETKFLVNHRVNLGSTVMEVVQRDIDYTLETAEKYDFGVTFNGKVLKEATKNGSIHIKTINELEPAPVSPSSGPVWDVLAGTIQNLFENTIFAKNPNEEKEIYITTGLFSGNTDTKYYWPLTKNIYRFIGSIIDPTIMETVHSVNEHVDIDGHLSAIAFIYEFIVNVNEHAQHLA